jgi:hypothetical protein
MYLGSRARPTRMDGNLTAICEPIVYTRQCGILNISQHYRPPRPVTGTALLFFIFLFLCYFTGIRKQTRKADETRLINVIPLGSILLRMYYKYITQVY